MMCIVIIAQYADCTPSGFGSRQKVRSVVHPRAAILHFDYDSVVRGSRYCLTKRTAHFCHMATGLLR